MKHGDAYLAFLLNETQRIDEKGFASAVARRAGSRVKNALKATAGGNWTGFGSEAKGQLYTMDIAGKLRRAWFQYAGKLKGRPDAKPTYANVKNWLKKVYDVDVKVPTDAGSDEEPGDQIADAEADEIADVAPEQSRRTARRPAPAAANDTDDADDAQSGDDAAPESDPDGELDVPDNAQADAEPDDAPASAAGDPDFKPREEPAAEPELASAEAQQVQTMIAYMQSGMGVKGFKPSAKVLGAQGRDAKQHLSYLRRFMQAAAGPDTVDPVTNSKPFANTNMLGKAIAQTTTALERGPEANVLKAVTALYGVVDQLPASEVDARKSVSQYLTGVVEDRVYAARYPKLGEAVRSEQTAEDAVPFATQFRKVGGMMALLKNGSTAARPTPQQTSQLVDGVNNLMIAARKGSAADREQLAQLMEPLVSDSLLLKKIPMLKAVLARYNNMANEAAMRYASHVLTEAGAEAPTADTPLKRVAFDKLFHDIAQQLIADGHISDGENPNPTRSSADSDVTSVAAQAKGKGKGKKSSTDDADEEDVKTVFNEKVSEIATQMGQSIPDAVLKRLVTSSQTGNSRDVIRVLEKLTDKRVLVVTVALLEVASQQEMDGNEFSQFMRHFSTRYRLEYDASMSANNTLVAAMASDNRRAIIKALGEKDPKQVSVICAAMFVLLEPDKE